MGTPLWGAIAPENVDNFVLESGWKASPSDKTIELPLAELCRLDAVSAGVLAVALLSRAERSLELLGTYDCTQAGRRLSPCITFALAHSGVEQIPCATRAIGVGDWRNPWTPGADNAWQTLFRTKTVQQCERGCPGLPLFERDSATFVDAHRLGRRQGRAEVVRLTTPWLRRMLSQSGTREVREVDLLLVDVEAVLEELLDNVQEHTKKSSGETSSVVQLTLHRDSEDMLQALHLVVIDTGPGIAATAHRKVALEKAQGVEILQGLLQGTFKNFGRARGIGLPTILEVVKKRDGTKMHIFSGTTKVYASGRDFSVNPSKSETAGTVFGLNFPIPHLR